VLTPKPRNPFLDLVSGKSRLADLYVADKAGLLITVAGIGLLLLLVLTVSFGLVNERRLHRIHQEEYAAVLLSLRVRELMMRTNDDLRDAVNVRDTDHLRETDLLRDEIVSITGDRGRVSRRQVPDLSDVGAAFSEYYVQARATSKRLIDGEKETTLAAALDTMRMRYAGALQLLDAHAARDVRDVDLAFAAAKSLQRTGLIVVALITLVFTVLVGKLTRSMARSLASSLGQAVRVADRLAQGDIAPRIEVTSSDEVGQLMRSMQRMLDYLREMSAAARSIASGDLSTRVHPRSPQDAFGTAFEQMTQYLTEISQVAGQIAGGNLSTQIALRSPADSLGNALTEMVGSLSRGMHELRTSEHSNRSLAEELLASRAHLERLVSSGPAVIYSRALTEAYPVTFFSSNLLAQFGHAPSEFKDPKFWETHVHPDDLAAASDSMSDLLRDERSICEYRFRHGDGGYRWIQDQSTIAPGPGAEGSPREIMGWWVDVTDRKLAEESLLESEAQLRISQRLEAVGQLAGGIAHDFNNLLTVILSYCDFLLEDLDTADPKREEVVEIKKAADRAASLTHQLLAFSRKQVLQPKVLDVNGVVLNMDKMLRRLIGEDIEFITSLEPALGLVKADPGQLEQVIVNCIVNARDAMPDGGAITVETRMAQLDASNVQQHHSGTVAPGNYISLTVSDTGCGMDAATQARIFEPFFTTKAAGHGTGLGLAMLYGIVKQSGGYVFVYSEVGHGTSIKIYLPEVQATAGPSELPEPVHKTASTETILLVEDEEMVRVLSRRILEGGGYTVLEARNGRDAVALCEQHDGPIDLLLTDVVMPEMGGRVLADWLRTLRPTTKVLFMSGYTDGHITNRGLLDSNSEYLEKPFTPLTLAAKVRQVLDSA
jgi:PAS domain S-box-containing protein